MSRTRSIQRAGLRYFCAAAVGLSVTFGVWARDILWSVPPDGGTPRDTNRIERLGASEFRIRTAFEDGGQSVLRHAVSRMDLVCINTGDRPEAVVVHLDLSGDGARTDYDNRPESGMRLRDFLFVRPPGGEWRQENGTTERWVATIRFEAAPGETKVGLSPWYTYADYGNFVNTLPAHPHLERKLAGKSDGGREHWELVISDPTVPLDAKRTIFWQAREHAYETYSSFAMEGLVAFLLSEEAAEFRRRYRIVLHPMTNIDGVAQGFEYRAGYDFPDPRGTATGRLTFETVDRLKPDFAVAWHNWIAPRDRNVMFYTDGENGRPTARAWWRFTQLFPSLRGIDHRWKDETTPLRYNWEGRRPLSEANIHQYAMKKHGTSVWGWEMPWWNSTPAQARAWGGQFGRAFLTTIEEIRSGTVPAAAEAARIDVPKWEMYEFALEGKAHVANPFTDAALVGEFVSPSGRTNVTDGFYDGGERWRLRFAPDEEGDWAYLLRGEGVEILRRGVVRCIAPASGIHGFIRVDTNNPYAFAHADGTPFLPMGDTCYGLFDDSSITPELRDTYLKTRRAQRFNFVRMTVGHSEARAAADPAYWAWGGTPARPDLDRLNPDFFRKFDELVRDLRSRGINIELILLNFYRRPFTDTRSWTPARERLWLRYLLARYGAFDNVFLWTVANEYETHPDGKYRLDFPADVAWARAAARFIKANDPGRHPVTVHPVMSASRRGETPRAPFDSPWRIGEFFGEDDAMDAISQQTGASDDGATWDESLQCWIGDSKTLVASLRADRRFKKPVMNTESGYEYLRGRPTERKQVHHTDKVRRSAWRIICAGGYFAAGFHGTIGHGDVWNRIDAPNRYDFEVKDEGAADQLSILHEFVSRLPYWRMQPFEAVTGDAVVLAEPGAVYLAYLPHGGTATLDLSSAKTALKMRWFNPRTGKPGETKTITSPASGQEFPAPDTNDWVLLLTQSQ